MNDFDRRLPHRQEMEHVVYILDGGENLTSLADFIADLQRQMAQIPEPYRESAQIRIRGDDTVAINTSYIRPENDTEFSIRQSLERSADEKDRVVYERLKQRFGA